MKNPLWSAFVHDLEPYTPGEQPRTPGLIKLNTNENPYPPSPEVNKTLQQFDSQRLRLYPDPESLQLRKVIADYYSLAPANVFVGNGSDEVLAHAFKAFFVSKNPIRFPDITYSFYPVYCKLFGINFQTVPLSEELSINVNDYRDETGGIIIANPNAPTGCTLSLDEVESLIRKNSRAVIIIDEAYVDFGAESAVALVERHENVVVVQTLSKSRSLAGLRIGFALANPSLIEALDRVKNSFNSYPIDILAQQCAIAALRDDQYFRDTITRIVNSRERLIKSLLERGIPCLPSKANFVFAKHPESSRLMSSLREKNVLVRYFNRPRIDTFLRISVGTESQHEALLSALDASF